MRDHNEFCAEIKRRKEIIKEKKRQRKKALFTLVPMTMCLAVLATFPWKLLSPPEIGNGGRNPEGQTYSDTSGIGNDEMTSPELNAGDKLETGDNIEKIESDAEHIFEETAAGTYSPMDDKNETMADEPPEQAFPETEEIAEDATGNVGDGMKYYSIVINDNDENHEYNVTSIDTFLKVIYLSQGVELIYGRAPEFDEDSGYRDPAEPEQATEQATEQAPEEAPDQELDDATEATVEEDKSESSETKAEQTGGAYTEETETVYIEFDSAENALPETALNFINVSSPDGERWIFTVDNANIDNLIDKIDNLYNTLP